MPVCCRGSHDAPHYETPKPTDADRSRAPGSSLHVCVCPACLARTEMGGCSAACGRGEQTRKRRASQAGRGREAGPAAAGTARLAHRAPPARGLSRREPAPQLTRVETRSGRTGRNNVRRRAACAPARPPCHARGLQATRRTSEAPWGSLGRRVAGRLNRRRSFASDAGAAKRPAGHAGVGRANSMGGGDALGSS